MSDFLTNLAARVSGSAESIRPRVPSPFEPRRPSSLLRDSPPEVHEETSEVIRQESAPLRAESPRQDDRSEPPPALSPEDNHSERVKPLIPQPPPVAAKVQTHAFPSTPQPTTPPRAPQPQIAQTAPRQKESEASVTPKRATLTEQPTLPTQLTQLTREEHTTLFSRVDTSPVSFDRISQLVRSMLAARAASPARARADRHQSTYPVAPEPVIHVSIGRIEVRATSQPTSPQTKERVASPVMSLDDYLKQRRTRA